MFTLLLLYCIYFIIIIIIIVTDALNWLAIFRKDIYSLRDRERLLKSRLMIFGINYPDSRELAQLDKVNIIFAHLHSSCWSTYLYDFPTLFYSRRI